MSSAHSLWRALEDFPPYYVRLLAKKPGSGRQDMAISDTEIAITSGIPLVRVRAIARSVDWKDVTVGEVLNFCVACNFDPASSADRQRVRQYEYVCKKRKKRPFQWLKLSPFYESELLPLIRMMQGKLLSTASPMPISVAAR